MILEEFYKAIMVKVLAEVSEIEYFEMFNNQYNNEEDELNFNMPAVFFEYTPITWETLGNKVQQAECNFKLHLVTETISETSNLEQPNEVSAGLQHLTLGSLIAKALQGFNGTDFGSISRTGVTPDNNHGAVLATIIDFRVLLTDKFNKPVLVPVVPAPNLQLTREFEA